MHQYPPLHPHADPASTRSVADVWGELPTEPGHLTRAVGQVLAPMNVGPVRDATEQGTARPRPYRDPLGWMVLKHVVQLALVGSVLLFVFSGGEAPMTALSYVATGLLLMGVIVLADRQRFADRDPAFEIIEFIPAPPRPVQAEPVVPRSTLVPLVEQMQTVLPERVAVT